MRFLLDTNVVSEIRKGDRADVRVQRWFDGVDREDLCLSVLVVAEITDGAERLRRRDPAQAQVYQAWLAELIEDFSGRLLPVTLEIARAWGRLSAIRPLPALDSLMAATALVHGLTFVTRNGRDVAGTGVDVLDPFEG